MQTLKEMDTHKNIRLLFYVTFVGPFSLALFFYGFFPLLSGDNTIATLNDVPKFVESTRVKTESLYQPMVKRLVIMIIDGLRWDFVNGPVGKIAMPVTSSLIANSSACLLQVKVQIPTVTMPRIKAITTGTVPSFIDVVLNFGSKPVASDNIILQVKRQGYKTVFYGDDTWLALFPNMFERYDGTTSFVVTDFTEVDNNVTRHLPEELNNDDWSVMVLHYLGIDHIGHVYGPFSPFIKSKLREMDNIIAMIQLKIQEWNQNDIPSLFIISGDHGIKDTGGHGGATTAETTVPLVAIGGECFQKYNRPTEIAEIDITSTLSVILGLPIPFSNLGSAFVDTLYELPVSKKLFILYYNAKQVFNHFRKLSGYESQYAYHKYIETIRLHTAWLNTKDQPNDMVDDIIYSYNIILKEMKEVLISSMIKYDSYIITTAIFFMCQIMCIMIGTQYKFSVKLKETMSFVLLTVTLWIVVNYFWDFDGILLLSSRDFTTIVLILFTISVLMINCHLLAGIKSIDFLTFERTENGTAKWILSLATLIHAISFCGSSFVEEEHQTWYFYWVTLLTGLLFSSVRKLVLHLQSYRSYKQCVHARICIKLMLLLIAHRILRKLNSTGNKYAHLPDISGFLKDQENHLAMTFILVAALILLIWIGFVHEDTKYKQQSLIFNTAISICIYLRHMHENSIAKIPLYPNSSGVYEVQIFWVLILIHFINCTYRIVWTMRYNKTKVLRDALLFIVQTWVMITAMLHRPYNVILLPLQIIFSTVIPTVVKDSVTQEINTFIYSWCGSVFYFYQGNSNSLATLDVAVGYIGIQSYMPLISGILIAISTYSAPVLAYLLHIYHAVLQYPHETQEAVVAQIGKLHITRRFLPVTIYTIIISIQRHHLFIWSVFSPKLLYEAVHSIVVCLIVLITLIPVTLHKMYYSLRRNK